MSVPNTAVYYVDWAIPNKRVWVCGDSGIKNLYIHDNNNNNNDNDNNNNNDDVDDKENYEISFHQMTCCGVDYDHNNGIVAVGDFAGSVYLWKEGQSHPFRQTQLVTYAAVRTLCWSPDGNSVYIGCLDGNVYIWNVNDNNDNNGNNEPIHYFSMADGVTCLKWENGEDSNRIAVATTGGTLAIVKPQIKEPVLIELAIKAHLPQHDNRDDKFGSLHKFAEIWSLTWSPDNTQIATCSEDKSICIWNLYGEKLHTLTGHTLAVTSVDWKKTTIGNVLVSCADDRTARLYLTTDRTVQLIHIFHAEDIPDWFTLTYLSIEDGGSRFACVTQNGYLIIWNLVTKDCLFKEKTHAGSIEGLRWNIKQGLLISCSSDCTVNTYHFQQESIVQQLHDL